MIQNNFILKNKLRNYSILASSVLMASTSVEGQIIYHDIIPDRVLTGNRDTMQLDLNGDGVADYELLTFTNDNSKGIVNTVGAAIDFLNTFASIAGTTLEGARAPHLFPDAYDQGKIIGPKVKFYSFYKLTFLYDSQTVLYYPVFVSSYKKNYRGQWRGAQNKYLPLKINSSRGSFYGWVRCSVNERGNVLTIKDYAYESIPDSSIIAGDTGTGPTAIITIHQLQNFSIYSSGKNIFVKYANAQAGMTIAVTDMLGKEISSIQTTSEFYEINLRGASSGIYTVTVQSRGAEMIKKISIQ